MKKTDILEALEDKNSKKIIIFDEINLPVLDLLTNIFYDKKVVFPDGKEIILGNTKIIGIINRNNNEILFDKIPLKLKSKCIFHIVESPNANDLKNIIVKLFSNNKFNENDKNDYINNYLLNYEIMNENQRNEILKNKEKSNEYYIKGIKNEFEYFSEKFIECLNYIKKNSIEPVFNLFDIKKYIDFILNLPKSDKLHSMLFKIVYRFENIEIQEKMKKLLNLNLHLILNLTLL